MFTANCPWCYFNNTCFNTHPQGIFTCINCHLDISYIINQYGKISLLANLNPIENLCMEFEVKSPTIPIAQEPAYCKLCNILVASTMLLCRKCANAFKQDSALGTPSSLCEQRSDSSVKLRRGFHPFVPPSPVTLEPPILASTPTHTLRPQSYAEYSRFNNLVSTTTSPEIHSKIKYGDDMRPQQSKPEPCSDAYRHSVYWQEIVYAIGPRQGQPAPANSKIDGIYFITRYTFSLRKQ